MANTSAELQKKTNRLWLIPAVIILVAALAGAFILVFAYEKELPQVSLLKDISLLGASSEIQLVLTDAKSGIRSVNISLVQDDKQATLVKKTLPRQGYLSGSGPNRLEETIPVNFKKLGFADGKALLLVEVRDFSWSNWMAGNESSAEYQIEIDTTPPRIHIMRTPQYIAAGGSGVVTYQLNEPASRHGVTVNDLYYPGFPLNNSGTDNYHAAFIGLPFSTEQLGQQAISATDLAGNPAAVSFGMNLHRRRMTEDRIAVSENFLQRKIPEFSQYYPELNGSLLEQYVSVNNSIRKVNDQKIQEICRGAMPERLWQGRFKRMSRGANRAGFADHRTYFFDNREIDRQVHLGVDLASTEHADIRAANRGKVVFADYLGIYGNTVILDHGQGVFSLYAHLSDIKTENGALVEQDAVIGSSGSTGMAGGDHLHFSMLVNGIFVNPLEWWDISWLEINMIGPLQQEIKTVADPF